jgi:hypothetical protein
MLEIEGDRALVAAQRLPPETDAVLALTVPAGAVGSAGVLHLHHLGAEVAEVGRGERSREQRGRVDHAQTLERSAHGRPASLTPST